MKRIFTFGLMLTAVFALTNCTEELVNPTVSKDEVTQETTTPENEGVPFQIHASFAADTKTVGAIGQDSNGKTVLKTNWSSNDKINVFHALAGTEDFSEFVDDGLFELSEDSDNIFNGSLAKPLEASKSYDWYFVYVVDANNEAINISDPNTSIAIGNNVQQYDENVPNKYISGVACPMYGVIRSLSAEVTPRIQMRHMASLLELSIKNNTNYYTSNPDNKNKYPISGWTPNELTIESIMFASNSTSSAIAGHFETNVRSIDSNISFATTNPSEFASSIEMTLPEEGIKIGVGQIRKFYFALAPFSASGNTLKFVINGSERFITTDQTFAAGKVIKMTLPINELHHPFESNAINLPTGNNGYVLLFDDVPVHDITPLKAYINGQETSIYKVGANKKAGKITIQGLAGEMLHALPTGFYASSWNQNPTAMTISRIEMNIPRYKSEYSSSGRQINYSKIEKWGNLQSLDPAVKSLASMGMDTGIDLSNGLSRPTLTRFVSPQTITFNGVITNGIFKEDPQNEEFSNVIILKEEEVHKDISIKKVNDFLPMFSTNDYTATLDGLYGIVDATLASGAKKITWDSQSAAMETGRAIYNKIFNKMQEVLEEKLPIGAEYATKQVFWILFKGSVFAIEPSHDELLELFMHSLRDIVFTIEIETYPYAENKADYGVNGAPLTPNTDIQPIVFWGLHATNVPQ